MRVGDIMNVNASRVPLSATVRHAAELLSSSQASDLMVVDEQFKFVGVLSEGDLIRLALPDFEELLMGGGSLAAGIEMFIDKGREMADRPIAPYVIESPVVVTPDTPVLRAASIMITKQIRRLPVVSDGQLVGSVSRADICLGVLGS